MDEGNLDDKMLDVFTKVVHPVPAGQDGSCPHIEWMGEDLVHCPGVGEWKCQEQKYEYGDYGSGGNFDYRACNSADYTACPIYLNLQAKQ